LQVDPLGEEMPSFVKLGHDLVTQMHLIQVVRLLTSLPLQKMRPICLNSYIIPSDLVGHTFLLDPQEEVKGYMTALFMPQKTMMPTSSMAKLHGSKFCCSINDSQCGEILSYNKILNYIEQQMMMGPNCAGSSGTLLCMKPPLTQVTRVPSSML